MLSDGLLSTLLTVELVLHLNIERAHRLHDPCVPLPEADCGYWSRSTQALWDEGLHIVAAIVCICRGLVSFTRGLEISVKKEGKCR